MTKPTTVALTRTRALLERFGWQRKGINNDKGFAINWGPQLCIHDALIDAAGGTLAGGEAVRLLSLMVAPDGRGTSIELVAWNDARGRTAAEVFALLDAAIAQSEVTP